MPTKKERLAALEAQLDHTGKLTDGVERTANMLVKMQAVIDEQTQRHDTAMDIIAERHAEIVARLDALEQLTLGQPVFGQANGLPVFSQASRTTTDTSPSIWEKLDEAFPTGAATTVDEVLAAMQSPDDGRPFVLGPDETLTMQWKEGDQFADWKVQPKPEKPRRGDRVRLEKALSNNGAPIPDGWYDVVGHDTDVIVNGGFQVVADSGRGAAAAAWTPWVRYDSYGLKELRRGTAYTVEPVDEKDLDV